VKTERRGLTQCNTEAERHFREEGLAVMRDSDLWQRGRVDAIMVGNRMLVEEKRKVEAKTNGFSQAIADLAKFWGGWGSVRG
jgi:hypothetical protein